MNRICTMQIKPVGLFAFMHVSKSLRTTFYL